MDTLVESPSFPLQDRIAVKLALAWAAGFLLAGILGFVPNPVLGPDGLFLTNAAHNMVHVVSAAAFLAVAVAGGSTSTWFMKAFGVVYLLVGVVGALWLAGDSSGYLLGLVHINSLDNLLHLGLGAGILASGLFVSQLE